MDWLDAFTTVLEGFQAPTGKKRSDLQARMKAFPGVVTPYSGSAIRVRWRSQIDRKTGKVIDPARTAAWGDGIIWGATVASSMQQARDLQRAADAVVAGMAKPIFQSRGGEYGEPGDFYQTTLGTTTYSPSGPEDREGALGEVKTEARALEGDDPQYGYVHTDPYTRRSAARTLRDRMAKKDPRYASLNKVYAVAYSGIIPPLRGLSIGRPMYIHHARFLNKITGQPQIMVSDSCYEDGSTSEKALRGWKSLSRDYPHESVETEPGTRSASTCYAVAIT